MVTQIHGRRGQVPARRRHLYIQEWMEFRGINDERLAGRLDVDRVTVTRWRNQQHRLNPDKIAAIAAALDIEPEQVWRPPWPPSRPSIDAMLSGASDEAVQRLAEVAAIILKTGS